MGGSYLAMSSKASGGMKSTVPGALAIVSLLSALIIFATPRSQSLPHCELSTRHYLVINHDGQWEEHDNEGNTDQGIHHV